MRSGLVLATVLLGGVAALALATDGFTVLTTEAARRQAVARQPIRLPVAHLDDGRRLADALAADGRVVLLDFIYTRCQSVCSALGSEFQQLQREIRRQDVQDRVRLLSLSFDPQHDRPPVLTAYQQALRADPRLWQAASVPDPEELAALLDAVGIQVVADGRGDFVHNAAIHLVAADGRLLAIHEPGRWRAALADALRREP